MNSILVGLINQKNFELITELLEGHYDITQYQPGTSIEKEQYDLIIMDGRTLSGARKKLQLIKGNADFLYQPVLLITTKKNLQLVSNYLWQVVDETVTLPVNKKELLVRVEMLLHARRLSLQLKSRNMEIEMENKRLDEQSKMLVDFFSSMSHEFRTPLSVIVAGVDLLNAYMENEKINPEKCKSPLYVTKQNCLRLQRLIANLLDLTKLDSGAMELSLSNIDIKQSISDIVNSIQVYARQKKIQLIFFTSIQYFETAVDEAMFDRILLNLLSNAVKNSREKGKIIVRMKLNKNKETFTVSVKDNGNGIPKEKQEIIFNRFTQAENSVVRQTDGCGLGLYIVKSLVGLHGGSIWVESAPGEGSTFTFEMPLRRAGICGKAKTEASNKANSINMEFSCI